MAAQQEMAAKMAKACVVEERHVQLAVSPAYLMLLLDYSENNLYVHKQKSLTIVRILIAGTKGKRVSGTGATAGTSGDCPTGTSCVATADSKKGTAGSCV